MHGSGAVGFLMFLTVLHCFVYFFFAFCCMQKNCSEPELTPALKKVGLALLWSKECHLSRQSNFFRGCCFLCENWAWSCGACCSFLCFTWLVFLLRFFFVPQGMKDILGIVTQIAEMEMRCGLNTTVDESVEMLHFGLVEVVYKWAKGVVRRC